MTFEPTAPVIAATVIIITVAIFFGCKPVCINHQSKKLYQTDNYSQCLPVVLSRFWDIISILRDAAFFTQFLVRKSLEFLFRHLRAILRTTLAGLLED